MNLYQLVYSSTRTPACTDVEIQKILDSCKRNNPGQNITGVLLHSEQYFIQYLEGSKDIIKVYDQIKTDPRHTKVVMLSYGPIEKRAFPAWHMGYKSLSKERIDFLTEGAEDEKKTFQAIIKGEEVSNNKALGLLTKFFQKG
jgi:hypothetical protein